MKKSHIIFTFLFLVVSLNGFAQKKPKPTKEEVALEKEWASKLKSLKPLDYKALVEEKDGMVGELRECEKSKNIYKDKAEIATLEFEELKKEMSEGGSSAAPATVSSTETQGSKTTSKTSSKGVVFKVQIGSFRNNDLTKYFDNNPNFSGEIDADGAKKYTLGHFVDYWEADNFKKALRKMGVKGAWVVPYKDGQRVLLKDVLEGAL